jgi:hypothetical protein
MCSGQSRLSAALLFTLVAGVASEARAQAKRVDPTAADVAVALRANGRYLGALSALTQARGPKSQRELDEIADTLVAIAATYRSSDEYRAVVTRTTALISLTDAGIGRTDIVGVEVGVPYAGTTPRLMRLAETAEDISSGAGHYEASFACRTGRNISHSFARSFFREPRRMGSGGRASYSLGARRTRDRARAVGRTPRTPATR